MAENEDLYEAETFEEFWVRYRAMHSDRRTRRAHMVGTTVGYGMVLGGVLRRKMWPIVVGPLAGHVIAQWSHRRYEGNRTTPGRRPLWHARAELRLFKHTVADHVRRVRPS
jgi:hypothetical protein